MKSLINKFVTKEFATWNICIFMLGNFLGVLFGLNEQALNLFRQGLNICGVK